MQKKYSVQPSWRLCRQKVATNENQSAMRSLHALFFHIKVAHISAFHCNTMCTTTFEKSKSSNNTTSAIFFRCCSTLVCFFVLYLTFVKPSFFFPFAQQMSSLLASYFNRWKSTFCIHSSLFIFILFLRFMLKFAPWIAPTSLCAHIYWL